MKKFIIADENGNVIYDDSGSAMMHMTVSQTLAVLNENFSDSAVSWRAGNKLFVVGKFRNIVMLSASDTGESVRAIQNQLRLLYDLLLLIFGPVNLHEKRATNFARYYELIKALVDAQSLLSEREIPFLVQATEHLQVSDDIRTMFNTALRLACSPASSVTHGFLFVGRKLFTTFVRVNRAPVHSIDVHLLILYLTSQFAPLKRDEADAAVPTDAPPVADYSNLDEKNMKKFEFHVEEERKEKEEQDDDVEDDDEEKEKEEEEEIDNDEKETIQDEEEDDDDEDGEEDEEEDDEDDDIDDQDDVVQRVRSGLGQAVDTLKSVVYSGEMPQTSSEPKQDEAKPNDLSEALFKILYLRSRMNSNSSSNSSGNNGDDDLDHVSRRVYLAPLGRQVVFVAVTKPDGNTDRVAERQELDNVARTLRDGLLKDYGEFLSMRASINHSMLSYAPDVPGLVHFVFVDRNAQRAVSPVIQPLHGQACRSHTAQSSARMADILKEQVWSMVSLGQAAMARGSMSTLVRRGSFLYSSRLWMEDGDGFELIFDKALFEDGNQASRRIERSLSAVDDLLGDEEDLLQSAAAEQDDEPQLSPFDRNNVRVWGPAFYELLVNRLYPTQRFVRCFELYTLYLGFVTTKQVAASEKKLYKLLNEMQLAS